jgi:hypothetical protein
MPTFKVAVELVFALAFAPSLLGSYGLAHADGNAGSFGVTITLQTFSGVLKADQRCTQHSSSQGQVTRLQIRCPASVNVQAIARTSSSKTGQTLRMNSAQAAAEQPALVAGQELNVTGPVELLISW